MYIYAQNGHRTQLANLAAQLSQQWEWKAQDCGISNVENDTSILPSKIDEMKASLETGSETNIAFSRAMMPHDIRGSICQFSDAANV